MRPAKGCGLTEALIVTVLSGGRAAWADALRLLAAAFEARGAEVIASDPCAGLGARGRLRALLSHGQGRDASALEEAANFYPRPWDGQGRASACETKIWGGGPYFACCVVPCQPDGSLGVVVWGDERDAFADLSLLRSCAHLMAYALRPQAAAPPPERDEAATPLPDGYVPGRSEAMARLHREISAVGRGDFPVLIIGETGVGKEHVARLLHSWSGHAAGPFVAVNCAALPAELMEAEMFGIGRGVASGVLERAGYFRLADGGTLFLDEIGELQPALQAKLLRALQDREVRQLGGASFKTDVRVVSATNADLRRRIKDGSFRADLYYRISGFELHVPPLRERPDDLRPLIEHFLKRYSAEAGKVFSGITPEALALLRQHHWPGNIRELEHEVRRLVYLCAEGPDIEPASLSAHILEGAAGAEVEATDATGVLSLASATARMERYLIAKALRLSLGNKTKAAALLGVTRNGLALKMERLGMTPVSPAPPTEPPLF